MEKHLIKSTKKKFIFGLKCSVIGGLIGYFIVHPLVMVISHYMLENVEQENFTSVIVVLLHSFSFSMQPWSIAFTLVCGFNGYILGKRNQAEKEIRRLSQHDPLTSLANRYQFDSRLEDAIKLANRTGFNFALLLLDLDKFKLVNDTYGHHAGDEILKYVAKVLQKCFRETDTVARMGGDEFVIIVTGVEDFESIDTPVKRVIEGINQPVMIEGNSIQVGVSPLCQCK